MLRDARRALLLLILAATRGDIPVVSVSPIVGEDIRAWKSFRYSAKVDIPGEIGRGEKKMNGYFKAGIVLMGILFLLIGLSSYKKVSAQECTPMLGIASQLEQTGAQIFRAPPGDDFTLLLEVVDYVDDTPQHHANVQTMKETADRAYIAFPPSGDGNVMVLFGKDDCMVQFVTIDLQAFLSAMAEMKAAHPERFGVPAGPKKDI